MTIQIEICIWYLHIFSCKCPDDEQGRPPSLSLPFAPGNQSYRGKVVSDYFDNLLPDSKTIRERIATRYKTRGTSPFELLSAWAQAQSLFVPERIRESILITRYRLSFPSG